MLLVFPGNPLVGLGHLVGQLSQHLVGSRSAWTGSAGTWSAAVWREREWLPSSSQLNLLPPFLIPSFPLRLNFSSPTSSFPPSPGSPPSLSYFPRAGNYSRRLFCEARRHQFGERSEPRPRRRAARPPPSSTGCSAGRTAGGS